MVYVMYFTILTCYDIIFVLFKILFRKNNFIYHSQYQQICEIH